jgi:hypothetical protein
LGHHRDFEWLLRRIFIVWLILHHRPIISLILALRPTGRKFGGFLCPRSGKVVTLAGDETPMGRDSRRRAELRSGKREPTPKERLRAANKAQRHGRRYGNTLAEYETLAGLHEDRMYAALIARHNARMENIAMPPDELRLIALDALGPVPCFDMILRKYGVDPTRHPSNYSGPWIDHLAWGVDSMVAAVRLLMSGQFIGAALVARHQLERWSQFRAFATNNQHRAGEPSLDFIARVWSASAEPKEYGDSGVAGFDTDSDIDLDEEPGRTGGEPDQSHRHVVMSDKTEICPAAVMGVLSDVLHALMGADAVEWDAVHRCDPGKATSAVYGTYKAVGDAVRLCGAQIGEALELIAATMKDTTTAELLANLPDGLSRIEAEAIEASFEQNWPSSQSGRGPWPKPPPGTITAFPPQALLPMHPSHGLRDDSVGDLNAAAQVFEAVLSGKKPAGRLFRDDEMMSLSFAWHRHAVARAALRALEAERKFLGEKWNLDGLRAREFPYLLTSEVAGLVCVWSGGGNVSAAAAAISTSIRSAYWLWLEDDDRAMGVLRTTLEQAARLRTWRRRPDKADRLEASERTTPRDWLDAAGWRRLEALNRALGEMAHARAGSRWHGARALLAQLQPSFSAEASMFTARGFCLDTVVSLAARELVATTLAMSPHVASAFASVLGVPMPGGDQTDAELEQLMDRAFAQRKTSLGSPTLPDPGSRWPAGVTGRAASS